MTKQEFIDHEVSVWGEDYIFDLLDRGYEAVQLSFNGDNSQIKWWWRHPIVPTYRSFDGSDEVTDLTQPSVCATIPASRSVVSPVSTD